jgi:hypothetical protein
LQWLRENGCPWDGRVLPLAGVMTISWSGQSTMAVPLNTRKRYCAVLMWRQWRVCRFVRSKQWESLKTPLFQLPSREWTIFGSCVMRYFEIVIIM